jgi:hypothetical protein
MRATSAGVPTNAPTPPAVIPVNNYSKFKIFNCNNVTEKRKQKGSLV